MNNPSENIEYEFVNFCFKHPKHKCYHNEVVSQYQYGSVVFCRVLASLAPCLLSPGSWLHCSCWNYSSAELIRLVFSHVPGAWRALFRDLSWAMDRGGTRRIETCHTEGQEYILSFLYFECAPTKGSWWFIWFWTKPLYIFLDPPTPIMYIIVKYAV